VMISRNEATW